MIVSCWYSGLPAKNAICLREIGYCCCSCKNTMGATSKHKHWKNLHKKSDHIIVPKTTLIMVSRKHNRSVWGANVSFVYTDIAKSGIKNWAKRTGTITFNILFIRTCHWYMLLLHKAIAWMHTQMYIEQIGVCEMKSIPPIIQISTISEVKEEHLYNNTSQKWVMLLHVLSSSSTKPGAYVLLPSPGYPCMEGKWIVPLMTDEYTPKFDKWIKGLSSHGHWKLIPQPWK